MTTSLDLLAAPLFVQPRRLLAILAARTHSWPTLRCPPASQGLGCCRRASFPGVALCICPRCISWSSCGPISIARPCPPDGSPALQHTKQSPQFDIISKLEEKALSPTELLYKFHWHKYAVERSYKIYAWAYKLHLTWKLWTRRDSDKQSFRQKTSAFYSLHMSKKLIGKSVSNITLLMWKSNSLITSEEQPGITLCSRGFLKEKKSDKNSLALGRSEVLKPEGETKALTYD